LALSYGLGGVSGEVDNDRYRPSNLTWDGNGILISPRLSNMIPRREAQRTPHEWSHKSISKPSNGGL
jgi:hypothetical protein